MEFIGTTVDERSFNRCYWGTVNLQVRLERQYVELGTTVQLGNGQSTGSVRVTCIC